jgi:hypothetical protein
MSILRLDFVATNEAEFVPTTKITRAVDEAVSFPYKARIPCIDSDELHQRPGVAYSSVSRDRGNHDTRATGSVAARLARSVWNIHASG